MNEAVSHEHRPPLQPLSLSIVLPCRNEQTTIQQVVRDAANAGRAVTADSSGELEIIVVDDASTDRTSEVLDSLKSELPELRIIRRNESQGYGAALRTGFTSAQHNWIFYTDADGQFRFDQLPDVFAMLQTCDIVSGYRARRNDPLRRRFLGWLWSTMTGLLLNLKLRDINCAYKAYPRSLFEQITLQSNGAAIDAEVLAHAQHLGYTIKQMPITHHPRQAGQPSGGQIAVMWRGLRELLTIRARLKESDVAA